MLCHTAPVDAMEVRVHVVVTVSWPLWKLDPKSPSVSGMIWVV